MMKLKTARKKYKNNKASHMIRISSRFKVVDNAMCKEGGWVGGWVGRQGWVWVGRGGCGCM